MIKLLSILSVITVMSQARAQAPVPIPFTPEQLRVFAEVMPYMDIFSHPKETKKSFEVHLLDSYEKYPSFHDITDKNLKSFSGTEKIKGTMKYVKAIPMPYAYDVTKQAQVYTFEVRIYFIGASQSDKELFDKLLLEAEQIWNSAKPNLDFAYEFKFTRVDDIRKAHYRPAVLNSTRGPYNISWGRNWTGITVAHELGHMMGLADEYETITSESYCLPQSLMCSSWQGQLMKHHYYFILRRLVN